MEELTLDQLAEAARRRMIALERVAEEARAAMGCRPTHSLMRLQSAIEDLDAIDHELQEIQR